MDRFEVGALIGSTTLRGAVLSPPATCLKQQLLIFPFPNARSHKNLVNVIEVP
jgi:hypothetical protein